MSAGTEDVFLDAEEEITPRRRSGRKRRRTAGSSLPPTDAKKARPTKKMPTQRRPNRADDQRQAGPAPVPPDNGDQEAFWARMRGILGEMETRLKQDTTEVKTQLGQAIGDLGEEWKTQKGG